jgi:hypothetical protein
MGKFSSQSNRKEPSNSSLGLLQQVEFCWCPAVKEDGKREKACML